MNKKAFIYAVMNRKGGVGKTTTAVTLAHGLAMRCESEGEHVLLLDLDPQGNVCHALGLSAQEVDIAEVLTGQAVAEKAIISADRSAQGGPHRPNLWVLPASDALADAKLTLVTNAALSSVVSQFGRGGRAVIVPTHQLLTHYLAKALATFRYIIIDCPPSLDMLAMAVYHFADYAIVPVKVDYLGVGGTARHTRNIIEAQAEGIDITIKQFVPTFFRSRELLARQMLEALRDSYGAERVSEPIPQAVALEQAPAMGGLTIFEYAPTSIPAVAYQLLIDKLYYEQPKI